MDTYLSIGDLIAKEARERLKWQAKLRAVKEIEEKYFGELAVCAGIAPSHIRNELESRFIELCPDPKPEKKSIIAIDRVVRYRVNQGCRLDLVYDLGPIRPP